LAAADHYFTKLSLSSFLFQFLLMIFLDHFMMVKCLYLTRIQSLNQAVLSDIQLSF
jgi:hypothetical protein